MRNCMDLLNEARTLAEREFLDLAGGDVGAAEEKAELRGKLLEQAWQARGGASKEDYMAALRRIQELQEHLLEEGIRMREVLRSQLIEGKQEGRRISGYRKAVSQAVRCGY